jgi:aryl-alcohol dehydrogenase-like predicted oxidoreductase
MELCLGTVQFGMDYSIRKRKKPSMHEAIQMLDYATQNGITNIDTAAAYGTAEDVVGEFLARKTVERDKLFIISKFPPNLLDEIEPRDYKKKINECLLKSLKRLHTDYLDSYIFHSSRYAFDEEKLEALYEVKEEEKIRHCGVSVYYPEEAKICIESPCVDFIQLPSSLFDQRMLRSGIFELADQNKSTQIHSRSAFIQGLLLINEKEVPDYLKSAIPLINKMEVICKAYGISRVKLAILFVKLFSAVSHLVFGVHDIEQLKEDIDMFSQESPNDILTEIATSFDSIPAEIVVPSLWIKE